MTLSNKILVSIIAAFVIFSGASLALARISNPGGSSGTSVTYPLSVANGGTGISALGTGMATWWATPSSANLASTITDETGTAGAAVFSVGPALTGNTTAVNLALSGTATSTGYANFATTTVATVASSTAAVNRNRTLYVDGSVAVKECTLADGATVTWDLSQCSYARVALGGNRTLDITNETQAIGQSVRLVACANGGSYSISTWDGAIIWSSHTAPTQSATSNECDTFAGFVTAATGTTKIFMGAATGF